ncbi:hypothetical protein OVA07_00590 [Novosphingobium sp. SL115]|nr:hypothetical protein [Novosphingobium sp. SL115]MCY1669510.1 hypothetical protein [Novosphingobium sp. SL115]
MKRINIPKPCRRMASTSPAQSLSAAKQTGPGRRTTLPASQRCIDLRCRCKQAANNVRPPTVLGNRTIQGNRDRSNHLSADAQWRGKGGKARQVCGDLLIVGDDTSH